MNAAVTAMRTRIRGYGSAYGLWLDGDTQDKLRKIARDRKTTMARVVREYIMQGIERELK